MKTQETTTALQALGLTLTVVNGPFPQCGKDNWPAIQFTIRLDFASRHVIETDYSLGIGHVKIRGASPLAMRLTPDETSMLSAWQQKPFADFKDKRLQAAVACKLAVVQKLRPSLPDVVYSLFSDGACYFSGQSFESWAVDYGYDADSRKAETTYRACMAVGQKLMAGVPDTARAEVALLLQDY